MNTKNDNLRTILDSKIIAIIRADDSSKLMPVVNALVDGGIRALEVTMTTPGALEAIRAASQEFGDRILVGVGLSWTPKLLVPRSSRAPSLS